MKILTVVQHLGSGGNERVAQNFSLIYKLCGHEVAVLAIDHGGVREEILNQNNIKLFLGASEREEKIKAVQQAIAWKPDLVHIHKAGVRDDSLIEILRDGINDRVPFLEKQSFSQVSSHNHLIDLNVHQTRWCFWKFKGMATFKNIKPEPPSVIIPNPTEASSFFRESKESCQTLKRELGIPEQSFVYGRVGQPFDGKWHSIIIKAFSDVIQQERDAFLLLVGSSDSIKSHVEKLPEFIRKRVFLVDYIYGDENLRIAYSAIDVFVHAAKQGESFGMVLVEAMLCKTPVITLATPYKDNSQVEVVGHGVGGLVVYDPKEFSSAMLDLFDDRDYLTYLSTEARKRALNNFSFEAVTNEVKLLLHQLEQSKTRSEFLSNVKNCSELVTDISGKEVYNLLSLNNGKIQNHIISRFLANPQSYPWITKVMSKIK